MGDTDVAALNGVLKWVGLEMTSPDTVRVRPDDRDRAHVRTPATLLIPQEPDARGEYRLQRSPELTRVIGAFAPLATPLWREEFARRPAVLHKQILDRLRGEIENTQNDSSGRHARILATTLYWSAVKSLGLNAAEARHEAASLRAIVSARKNLPDRPSQEIARNADLALGVLLESYPNAK